MSSNFDILTEQVKNEIKSTFFSLNEINQKINFELIDFKQTSEYLKNTHLLFNKVYPDIKMTSVIPLGENIEVIFNSEVNNDNYSTPIEKLKNLRKSEKRLKNGNQYIVSDKFSFPSALYINSLIYDTGKIAKGTERFAPRFKEIVKDQPQKIFYRIHSHLHPCYNKGYFNSTSNFEGGGNFEKCYSLIENSRIKSQKTKIRNTLSRDSEVFRI